MKKLGKKLLSVLLVLCIAVSMTVMAMPSAQAISGAFFKKKAIDLGLRFACAAATQLAGLCENDDASIVVDSVIKFIISDAHGATTSEIKKMCSQILEEIAVLKEDIQEYSSEITIALDNLTEEQLAERFEDRWESDVNGIVKSYRLTDILDTYTRYLIVSTLYGAADIDSDTYAAIESYWNTISNEKLSYTYEDCLRYQAEFIEALGLHVSLGNPKESVLYENAQIFADIKSAIEDLIENFTYDSVSTNGHQYSVIECAATEAYFALPFSSQQYEYIVAQAKNQVMVATLLEMALNEYLSLQGEYLVKNNISETVEFGYVLGNQSGVISYETCKDNYVDLADKVLEETCYLFERSFTVNTKAHTGKPPYERTLDDYMKPEDAVATNLKVNGFESKHYYGQERLGTEMYHMYAFSNMTDYPSSINNPTRFIRVKSGDPSGEVYYILDASQYPDASYLDFTQLKHDVKREYVTDGGVGDLHIVSCDYYNLIKQMTDGVNTYKMPTAENLNAELGNLVDVPSYYGESQIILSKFLSPFAPSTIWGTESSSKLRVLTSSYDNNLKVGAPTAVKRADISVVDADSTGINTGELVTYDHQIHEDLRSKDYSFLAILASDTNNPYKQKVSVRFDDAINTFDKSTAYIMSENGDIIKCDDTMNFEPGTKLTIDFVLENPYEFDSLKMVRKNAEESETVLLSGYEELSYHKNEKTSGYSLEVTMPYSEVQFVFTSKKSDYPVATVNIVDDTNAIFNFQMLYNDDAYYVNQSSNVKAGDEVELRFRLNNVSQFKAIAAVNHATSEITVLVDKDKLSTMTPDDTSWYSVTTTMPNYDTDFYAVSEEPEAFTPVDIEQDENGTYIIRTYEDLRSMAYHINNNETEYMYGDYILANDINVMNRPLEPIGYGDDDFGGDGKKEFYGTFEGQGYTISNFKILSNNSYEVASLFGYVNGEIRNLNLAGDYTASATGNYYNANMAGLACGISETGKVENVTTNLTYKIETYTSVTSVSGIANSVTEGCVIDKCLVNDTVYFPEYTPVYSGIFSNGSSYETYHISNCGNTSTVTLRSDVEHVNGLVKGVSHANYVFDNCYSAVTYNGDNLAPVMLNTLYRNVTANNCYYLDSSVGENSECTDIGTPMSIEQFESGEVAYLLNEGVTDGTQVWYQNIDNGETPDAYPVFEGGTVYKSAGTCIGEDIGYTNTPGEITHNYNNYHVCKDCISLRPGEAAGIYGFSIGLGGNISVKYYMVLDEEVAADETAKMIFTVPDTGYSYDIEIPVSEAQVTQMTVPATGETRTIHIFECEVAAKEMTSDIYCQVVTDTRESDVFTYNVKEYADVILTNSESFEREVPLVKAMLNYGAYAQLSFDYNTKNLANTSEYITEEEKVLTPADFSSYGFTLEGEEEAISYYGSAISLKSETAIKHYFYFENDEDVENTVVTVNGEKVTPVKNGGYYEIKVSDIPAHMLNENYEVKVGDITLNYSVFSYCNVATGKANDQKLIDVANALYAYNQAAINYIG